MGHPADVPQLQKYRAAIAVDLIGYQTPALLLGWRVDAGGHGVAVAGRRNVRCLGDDQAGTGSLPVVGGHQFIRDVTLARSRAPSAFNWPSKTCTIAGFFRDRTSSCNGL